MIMNRTAILVVLLVWFVVSMGGMFLALVAVKRHEVAKRLGRRNIATVAALAGGFAQYLMFGVGLPFSWSGLAVLSSIGLLPAVLFVTHVWYGRLVAIDDDGLSLRIGSSSRRLAWRDLDAVGPGGGGPVLVLRERGRGRTVVASMPAALVDPLLAALRHRVPLQRLDPLLWDDPTRLWASATLSAEARLLPPAAADRTS